MAGGALFRGRYRVYWSETDAAGIAHFSSFFRYLERAEEDFVRELLGVRWSPRAPILFPRVHASCDYEAPLLPGDEFTVAIVEARVGRSSIEYRFEVVNETRGWLAARCRLVVVAVDRETFKPVPVPGELREAIERAARGAGG